MREEEYPGRFIVIEGADGAGTTTQSEKLAEDLDAFWTSEPTNNEIGDKINELISDGDYSAETIALAFAADRMIHVEEEIIPKLEQGETVVCDRYYHSSLVYQSILGAELDWVKDLNKEALKPDVTFILDISAEIGMERVTERGMDENIFEHLDFQQEVVKRYNELSVELDERTEIIDGSQSMKKVFQSLKRRL